MSGSKKPVKQPPEDEPEWLKESKKKWTPEAIKAAQEEEARQSRRFWDEWLYSQFLRYLPDPPAGVIDLVAYRKNRSK